MTTHRFLQLHRLIDNASSRARQLNKAAVSALKIGNFKAADCFFRKATRLSTIVAHAERLMSHKRPCVAGVQNKGPRPICSADCRYRQSFKEFGLQKNALRAEMASLINSERCGWNILPGMVGGHPLDYAPCNYSY